MEANQIIYLIIWVAIFIGIIIINKTSGNSYQETKDMVVKTNLIMQYAEAFVAWAKQFKSDLSGKEKMNAVVTELLEIADKYELDISETEICAIAQQAYDTMKNKEESIKAVSTTYVLPEIAGYTAELKNISLPEITDDNINELKISE